MHHLLGTFFLPCIIFFLFLIPSLQAPEDRNPALSSPVCLHSLASCWHGESSCKLYGGLMYTSTHAPSKCGTPEPTLKNGCVTLRPEVQQMTYMGVGSTPRRIPSLPTPPGAVALLITKANTPLVIWGKAQNFPKYQRGLNPQMGYEFTLSESRRSMQEALVC